MVDFEVLNHGPARLFSLVADDDHGYLQKRGPHRLNSWNRKETFINPQMNNPSTNGLHFYSSVTAPWPMGAAANQGAATPLGAI